MARAIRGKWEAAYPWLSALLVGLGAWFFIPAVGVSAIHAVAGAFSAIAAIIVGFLATVLTLLAALGGGRPWRFLKDAGRIPQLLTYVRWPLDGGFALLALALLWDVFGSSTRWSVHLGLVLGAAILAFIATGVFRLTRILLILLQGL
ncbi:MAG: hypothetical protein OWV35_07885 [Firmicutes bacterium]|nr:hypothetical protein [Bacillota bacterium]